MGFLRYWTLSNLPLFLLAVPVLSLMVKSGMDVLRNASWPDAETRRAAGESKGDAETKTSDGRTRTLIASMAASQVLIAVLALLSYHVQIITRVASGYPVWCWWLAGCLRSGDQNARKLGGRVVVFGVVYALVQAALFACFLPPA